MTSRIELLVKSTVLNFLAIIFIIGNLSYVISDSSVAANIELMSLVGIMVYLAWFFTAKPQSVHTSLWVSRCACGIFWITLMAVGFEIEMPMLLWIVSAAASITFIGFALNESYSSLNQVELEMEMERVKDINEE
ncbi:MAG: hypothetical protein NC221_06705 [Duncaniella sp.]|nr:hypothetical protein [Duncaniella sp.]